MSETAAFGIGILITIALCYFKIRIEIARVETKVDELYMLLRDLRREMRR